MGPRLFLGVDEEVVVLVHVVLVLVGQVGSQSLRRRVELVF